MTMSAPPVQTLTYPTQGDLTLSLDLYVPIGSPRSDHGHPLVIWFHGGGLLQGSRVNLPTHFRQLAAPPRSGSGDDDQGSELMAVLSPDYRLAPQASLPEILHDIDALLSYIQSDAFRTATQNKIDVNRIALSGGSAGGYLALIAGLPASDSTPGLVANDGKRGIKCLAPYYPITNFCDPFWTTKQACPSWLSTPVSDEDALKHLDPRSALSTSSAPGSPRSCLYGYMLQHGLLASLLFPPRPLPTSLSSPADRYGFDTSIPFSAAAYSIPQHLAALTAAHKQIPPVYLTYGTDDDAVNPFDETVDALRKAGGVLEVEVEQGLGHAYDEDEKWWPRASGLRKFLKEHL